MSEVIFVENKAYNSTFKAQLFIYYMMSVVIPLFVVKNFTHEPSTGKHLLYVIGFTIIILSALFSNKKITIKYSYVHLAALGFGITAILSLISVSAENPQYFRYSLDVALFALFVVLTSFYISKEFDTRLKIEFAMFFFIIGAFVVAIDALLNYYAGFDLFLGKVGAPFQRASARSTIGNPNFVSDYMGLTIPMIIYFLVNPYPLKKVVKSRMGIILLKSSMLLFLAPMIAAVFVAETRTVMTGILLGNLLFIIVYLLLSRKFQHEEDPALVKLSRIFIVAALVLAIVLSILYLTPSPLTGKGKLNITRRLEYVLTSSKSWKERFSAWLNSIYQWIDPSHPSRIIFGTGIGTFQLYHLLYSPYVIQERPDYTVVWNNFKRTHNDYVQALSETGILGFSMVVLFLIFMVSRYFRTMLRLKNKTDILMYGAFGAAIFSLAMHTMFEFPLHMQPNLMAGVFIMSITMGTYFNDDLKELQISRTALAIPFVILSGTIIFLKTTAYLGEGFFRKGQVAQQYYYAYAREAIKRNPVAIKNKLKDLENYRGEFAYLKNVGNYYAAREKELRSKFGGLSQVEFLKAIESERKKEFDAIRANLMRELQTAEALQSKTRAYYNRAVDYFERSYRIYPVFGKPLWYLAAFGIKPERVYSLSSDKEKVIQTLMGEDPYAALIVDEFKGDLRVIPLPERNIRTIPFKEFVKAHKEKLAELSDKLYLSFLAQIQAVLDSIDYYESSMIFFSERQTPKIVGGLYKKVYEELKRYGSFLLVREKLYSDTIDLADLLMQIERFENYAKTQMYYWYDLAVTLLPGTWNRYSDWEGIYGEYMTAVVSVGGDTTAVSNRILEIAKKHAFACEGMWEGGYYGIPDDTLGIALKYAGNLKEKHQKEYERFMRELSEIYHGVYVKTKEGLSKFRSEELKKRAEKFIELYEKISTN